MIKNDAEMSFKEIDRNFEHIGQGNNAAVYRATNLHVIRVSFSELDGGRCIPYIPDDVREHLSLPRILRHWYDEETEYQITIVEKLNRLPYSIWGNNPVNLELFNGYRFLHTIDSDLTKLIKKDNPLYQVVSHAIEAFHYCNNNGLNLNSLDLNHANIMMRDNGELVLSDPFGSRDI